MLQKQYMHAYYMSTHVSEGLSACGCLHATRVYIHKTFAAGAACVRAHTYEHDREVCRKTSYTAAFLAKTLSVYVIHP